MRFERSPFYAAIIYLRKSGKTRHSPTVGTENTKFPNLLNRKFYASQPLSRIVTDMPQFYYRNQLYHFICYLDLFNNEILEWNVRSDETMQLVLPPLRCLIKRKRMSAPCFCTATRVLNTHPQATSAFFRPTILHRVCQELAHRMTTLLWKAFLVGLRNSCVLNILISMVCLSSNFFLTLSLNSIISAFLTSFITKAPFNLELNKAFANLFWLFLSTIY